MEWLLTPYTAKLAGRQTVGNSFIVIRQSVPIGAVDMKVHVLT